MLTHGVGGEEGRFKKPVRGEEPVALPNLTQPRKICFKA